MTRCYIFQLAKEWYVVEAESYEQATTKLLDRMDAYTVNTMDYKGITKTFFWYLSDPHAHIIA